MTLLMCLEELSQHAIQEVSADDKSFSTEEINIETQLIETSKL
jgi:hypothetical protein